MLGYEAKVFITHPCVCLDSLVPPDNFYRQVETKLDLTFVRDLVRPCYASYAGRPSIDPVVFFKLQLIMFFEGIRSERQLMDMVDMRLDLRWYLGYDLGEQVPNHSSLSRIRERYGLEVFQRFFERIVELCIEADLVWGKELYFDGTKVRANAAIDSLVPMFYFEAQQQAQTPYGDDCGVDEHAQPSSTEPEQPVRTSRTLVEKYDGCISPDLMGHKSTQNKGGLPVVRARIARHAG